MIAPFVTTDGSLNPLETLANDLNVYAGRGFPVVTQLQDASVEATGPTPSSAFYGIVPGLSWVGGNNYLTANAGGLYTQTARTLSADTLLAVPFIAKTANPITSIGYFCDLTSGGTKNLLIYDSVDSLDGNIYPNAKLYDSGNVAFVANNAVKHTLTTPLALTPGRLYWLVLQNGGTPSVKTIPVVACDILMGTNVGTTSNDQTTYLQASFSASSAAPAVFPAGAVRRTETPPVLLYGYAIPVVVALQGAQTFAGAPPSLSQQVFPSYSPTTDGWVVRGARIVAASTKRSGSAGDQPYLLIKARLRNAQGTRDLGVFDSRRGEVTAGVPFPLTGPAPIDQELPVGTSIEVATEQFGTSIITLEDVSVSWELARKKT